MKKFLTTLTLAVIAASVFNSCKKEDDDSISMSELQKGIVYLADAQGHEYEAVDMGFITRVCWGTCNLGATSPEQNGNFYAWGETQPKDNYTWKNYKWAEDSKLTLTKYNSTDNNGTLDPGTDLEHQKLALDKDDDCVRASRGGAWRLPTKEDFTYLVQHSTFKYCKANGVWGYMFTSTVKNYEDRSIFIPFAGMMDTHPGKQESEHKHFGKIGRYWTNTRKKTPSYQADVMELINTDDIPNAVLNAQDRYIGLPVRPVAVAND